MKVVVADRDVSAVAGDDKIKGVEVDVTSLEDWGKLKGIVGSELGGK